MGDSISIRAASRDDVAEILAVLSASLGETSLLRRTPEMFSWKHFDNPFGPSIVLVAEIGSRIAGVRAFMSWDLTSKHGHELRCVRAVDTATHPRFQGRGVFRHLTMSAVEQASDQGVDLIFNTPNERSGPGYLKMGWGRVGHLRPLVRPRLGGANRPDQDGLSDLSKTLPGVEIFTPRAMDREPLGLRTPRTIGYQQWRFGSHPTARYGWAPGEDGGGAVVRSSVRRGRVELLVSELTSNQDLLKRLARTHKARYMAASFTPGTPEWRSARRCRMFQPPGVGGLQLFAKPLTELDIDVFDLQSWDLTLGDLELL